MRRRKFYTRKMAEVARRFYLDNKSADFAKTANYLSKVFGKNFYFYDISTLFQFIVVLGNNLKTAEELSYEINTRNKHSNPYNFFLSLRKEYFKKKMEAYFIEKTLIEAKLYEELDFSYFEFSQDELELAKYKEQLKNSYDKAKEIDFFYYNDLTCDIREIEEKYKLVG